MIVNLRNCEATQVIVDPLQSHSENYCETIAWISADLVARARQRSGYENGIR